jgi:3-methyladenine DNA glycosylase AlkD
MKAKEAHQLGEEIAALVRDGQIETGYARLAPVLAKRTPFPMLERIGAPTGKLSLEIGRAFATRIAADKTEGGWVVIGAILREQIACDLQGTFEACKPHIIAADVWYGADILGERVPGPALASDFDQALAQLAPWREAENRWVRRAVGVAVHFWAKRAHGVPALTPQAGQLLDLLEPMFTEWQMDALKGVGWGLKTLGKFYPDLMIAWLPQQLHRKHRSIVVRKAITFLPAEVKEKIMAKFNRR